jgi:peptide/nickel transport system substrate-binding protein
MYKRIISTLVIIAIAIGISSCQPSVAGSKNQLVASILSDPSTFNAALNNTSPSIFGYVAEGLIGENGKGEVEPALAESWEVSPDKLKITVTLKPDLKWSDGQPLTVDDVIFTYNDVYLNENIPTDIRDGLKIGKDRKLPTVEKLDNRRVVFTTPEPFVPFLRMLGTSILPAHKLKASVAQMEKGPDGKPQSKFMGMWGIQTKTSDLVSNGLFTLASYTPGERLIFKKNPYYWRKDNKGNQQPYIDRLIWQVVESNDTSLVQFRAGNLDTYAVTPDFFTMLKKEEKKGDYTIYNGGPQAGTTFITFNLNQGTRGDTPLIDPVKTKWFNNVKFRQAVAYGIDRQRMINNIYRGLGAPQDSAISVPSPYYYSPKEGLKSYDYNPKKAKQLLQSAGFKYAPDGSLIDEDNNPVRFTLNTNSGNKIREAIGTQIKQDLGSIGINVDFNPISFDLLVDKLDSTFAWDCILIGFTGGAEPHDGINFWDVEGRSHIFNQKPSPQQPQLTGWQASEWEKKIYDTYVSASQEFDETKRRQLYIETQQITQEQLPCIYLVNPFSLSAVRNRIKGIDYSPLGGAFWNLHELKVTE